MVGNTANTLSKALSQGIKKSEKFVRKSQGNFSREKKNPQKNKRARHWTELVKKAA